MAYINPSMVLSPKASIRELKVVYDGGEVGDGDWKGWSIATFEWDGSPRVGVRWNGRDSNVGNPQYRGVPTWFVLPKPLADQALEAARAERKRVG